MRKYSTFFPSASEAIGSNGFKILSKPKFASMIAVTEYSAMENGLVSVKYLDAENKIVCESSGVREWFPPVGEVVEIPYNPQTFGEQIKEKRKALGATQTEISAFCDISMRTWQNWESDSSTPNYYVQTGVLAKMEEYIPQPKPSRNSQMFLHTCECGNEFMGGPAAKNCPVCRKEKHRELCRNAQRDKRDNK